uniref:pilus assembly protein n=1 Tax=Dokdonella sp. TaxID=2291710 RepID=UPI002636B2FC
RLDATGEPAEVIWDAGCLLSGGLCQEPAGSGTARDPGNRMIVTSNGVTSGRPFRWSSLDLDQQIALSQKPGAAACTALGAVGCDAFGSDRIDYLRGKRTNEAASATPSFRSRASVLGAVVNGEAAYVSSPRSGYHDMFPDGSPEAEAVKADEANSYAAYQNAQRSRKPMAYVGANDGMLHAFDAETGKEEWAYVPNTLIRNGRLAKSTGRDSGLTPGVDARPREADVFIKNKWRTVLLGSLRLGGRGIFALDVTQPTMASESDAAGGNGVLLWEFSNGGAASEVAAAPCSVGAHTCASLGYTYDSANIARIRFGDKWVAVVSSGYFPSNADAAAASHDRTDPAASRTSLLVIDLETGTLIREIRTSAAPQQRPSGFKTLGLSTPMVYDLASDEVDDIVYAGDLAGNLWRFDLTDAEDPNNWTVDLMFTTYGNGGADKAGNQPIVFNPTALRDPVTRRPILVFGTGKYLGGDDRTSAIPQQAYYGVRDYGADSDFYPIAVDNLVTQKMTQADDSTRSITGYEDPAVTPSGSVPPMYLGADAGEEQPAVVAHGWRIRLDVATEKGERAQRRAIPLATANVALLYGLIPKSDDPCDPGARYSIMAIDAATGSALSEEGGIAASGLVGAVLAAPTPPSDPVIKRGGDGGVIVGLPPGIPPAVKDALDDVLRRAIPPWHRGAWRELLGW